MPYNSAGSLFHRYRYNDTWSSWLNTALDSYPVNSIYISYSHTSPAEMFGGTWTRIENRFLWGCTAEGSIGHTGGESTHTLTASEMPKHYHSQAVINPSNDGATAAAYGYSYTDSSNGVAIAIGSTKTGTTKGWISSTLGTAKGGGAAHNNLPPYIHVSIWRRTA